MATIRTMSVITDYRDLLVSVTELKTVVSGLRDDIQDIKDTFKGTLSDHEIRIRSIEQWRWIQTGAAAISGAIVAQIIQLFSSGAVHF